MPSILQASAQRPHFITCYGYPPALRIRFLCDCLRRRKTPVDPLGSSVEQIFATRIAEADDFHRTITIEALNEAERGVIRQAAAGLLWSKQFYHYVVDEWLKGDSAMPQPPASRLEGRNHNWRHLYSHDVLSMPDKWEYPWFAVWAQPFIYCLFLTWTRNTPRSNSSCFC